MLTSHHGLISSSIPFYLNGITYVVNVMKDVLESLKLSLLLASNDFQYSSWYWWNDGKDKEEREDDNIEDDFILKSEGCLDLPKSSSTKS